MALLALAQLVSYLAVMRIDFARRLLAIVLSVALATGLVLHSAYASDMGAKTSDMQASDMKASAVMSSDMPMPGN